MTKKLTLMSGIFILAFSQAVQAKSFGTCPDPKKIKIGSVAPVFTAPTWHNEVTASIDTSPETKWVNFSCQYTNGGTLGAKLIVENPSTCKFTETGTTTCNSQYNSCHFECDRTS